jgi:hypothetical protein
MEVNSNVIKCAVMSFFRFKKGYLCCSELSYSLGIADVIAINDTTGEVIEIEIKISKSDLLNENKHKEPKHKLLKEAELYEDDTYPNYTPNKFYFCVPTYLVKEAKEYSLDMNKDYGILEFDSTHIHKLPEHSIFYRKPAYKLHKACVGSFFKESLIKRVCNDNIVFYRDEYWR